MSTEELLGYVIALAVLGGIVYLYRRRKSRTDNPPPHYPPGGPKDPPTRPK